jgi:tetraether lipid synthase
MLLKNTVSVCPTCLVRVPATVEERDGQVFLRKSCPAHGSNDALLSSDARLYWLSGGEGEGVAGEACASGCCATGHSCTLIFEITERCNLTCPTCFAGSSPHHTWHMSLAAFTERLDRLLAEGKRDADMVQLSGGEPTVHPDIERMIEICFERDVRKIYVNTNGIRLAREPDFAKRLAAIDGGRDRLQFYLQFDGFAPATWTQIRGARGLLPVKQRAIRHALDAGLFVLPVMTVTRGVNLGEIGEVIRMVRDHHPRMTTVMLQPAFYAGRYDNDRSGPRLTLAEVAHEVARQTDGLFSIDDFGPIPCSDPNCFALAIALVHDGKVTPISRYFPRYEQWAEPGTADLVSRLADRMPQHMLEALVEEPAVDALLDLLAGDDESIDWSDYHNFMLIGIKPFMDAHTYDQDRVDRCCVHVVDREGQPVSLCEYNTLRRPAGHL